VNQVKEREWLKLKDFSEGTTDTQELQPIKRKKRTESGRTLAPLKGDDLSTLIAATFLGAAALTGATFFATGAAFFATGAAFFATGAAFVATGAAFFGPTARVAN
jgi:predicted phage tail protein